MALSQPSHPTTRAKNATQHPGLVVLKAKQKRRCAAKMTKVRLQERLNRRLTERRLHVALKNVARVQDQQRDKDIKADIPKVAPSLRRHNTQVYHQDVPSMVIDCHDPSHGGFYMVEGAFYIRIGLPPHVVSGDCLVSSRYGLTARFLHCHRAYLMSRDWGCTSTYCQSLYVPISSMRP